MQETLFVVGEKLITFCSITKQVSICKSKSVEFWQKVNK
jgi:hypothetical protein